MSIYQAKRDNPFHISVGGLVVNADGKIRVHKRMKSKAPPQFQDDFLEREELYLLARETIEDGESLVEAVQRGVSEEFGIEGKVEKYLGALSVKTLAGRDPKWEWEKTTLYFLVTPIGDAPRVADDESFSDLEWHPPEFLIERMQGQGGEHRKDLDESKIVKTYVAHR